jgi:hypothetical protein
MKIIQTDSLAQAVERHMEYNYEQLSREKKTAKDVYIPDSIPKASTLKGMVSVQPGQKNSIFEIVISGGQPLAHP